MLKTFIFKQHDDILKDRSIQKIHVVNKGPTKMNDISSTFNSLGKCLIKEPK